MEYKKINQQDTDNQIVMTESEISKGYTYEDKYNAELSKINTERKEYLKSFKNPLPVMTTEELLYELERLLQVKADTKDFIEQMEVAGDIHAIEMVLNNIKPTDSAIDCVGCGS